MQFVISIVTVLFDSELKNIFIDSVFRIIGFFSSKMNGGLAT